MTAPTRHTLELREITVSYGALLANDRVSITGRPGEVHAILGENGAGKSTLVRVIAGLVTPDSGEVLIDGRPMHFSSALDAAAHGVGVVHQHFMLIPTMTVAQNTCLGLDRRLVPRLGDVERRLAELGERYRLPIKPRALVSELSVGERQRVEILKVLYRGARIIVLDEPTAVLPPAEVDGLFETVEELTAGGATVVFISHKLHEIKQISDRVTVLRHGQVVAERATSEVSELDLATLMVGRPVQLDSGTRDWEPGPVALETERLTVEGAERRVVEDVSFQLHAGEILGIAAIEGNGQHALMEAVVGLRRVSSGTLRLGGEDITAFSIAERIKRGLAHIPEDRIETALAGSMSIQANLLTVDHATPRFARGGWTRRAASRRHADQLVRDFDIRCRGVHQPVGQLSGGNQQKTVLARELSRNPRLLVAVHPARGLDIGAAEFVHRQLLALREAGCAVLLLSSELDELLALADRIAVMSAGRLSVPQRRVDVDVSQIGLMMAGHGRS
jgi:simple sugar transport system ATP-binding protein